MWRAELNDREYEIVRSSSRLPGGTGETPVLPTRPPGAAPSASPPLHGHWPNAAKGARPAPAPAPQNRETLALSIGGM